MNVDVTNSDVLFSHEAFSNQAVGGVTRCMVELMRGLDAIGADWAVWAGQHGNRYLHEEKAISGRIVAARYGPLMGRTRDALFQERPFARYATASRAKVVHRTYYPITDHVPASVARVVTLHDMHNELYHERNRPIERMRSFFKRRSLERADAIICISRSTLGLMEELWPHLGDRCVVIPHGVRRLSNVPIDPTRHRPFFLFVGGRAGQKNFDMALSALATSRLSDHELVCVGGGGTTQHEHALIERLGLAGRIHFVSADDDQLAGLYEAATAFLYPTRSEGFGMPILEAMVHNCPVVTTPLTSLPEVGGSAALYADPDDLDAWRALIEVLALDQERRGDAIMCGHQQAARFTWEENARQHLDLYRSVS